MNSLKEEWRDIEGYEGLYEVSNLGRVKSLGNGKSTNPNNSKERILKQAKDVGGYLRVNLCREGKRKNFKVHRLVAQTFIPNPLNLPQVNHRNEDKTDNRASEQYTNLEWISNFDNCNHGTRNLRAAKANTNGKCSKKVLQFSLKGELIREWVSLSEVKRQLGFSVGNISQCCSGKRKHAYGYVWRYAE